MTPRGVRGCLAAALLALGLMHAGEGVLIHAKAVLAQHLLRSAWSRTLASGVAHRPWPWADTRAVARLRLPGHGVERVVLAGASGESLAFGPAAVTTSESVPLVIAGHRDTHFRFLADVRRGDAVVVEDRAGRAHRFRVRATRIVDYRTWRPGNSALSLVTCYPFDAFAPGGPLRYVVETVSADAGSAPPDGGTRSPRGERGAEGRVLYSGALR